MPSDFEAIGVKNSPSY